MAAHIALLAAGIPHHKGVVGNILGHYRSGGYKAISAQGDAADYGGVGAYGGTAADEGFFVKSVAVYLGAGVGHIGKDTGRPQKNIVLYHRAGINGHVILDFYVAAYDYIVGHMAVLAEYAILAYFGAGQYMGEMPDLGTRAYFAGLVHIGALMNFHFFCQPFFLEHIFLSRRESPSYGYRKGHPLWSGTSPSSLWLCTGTWCHGPYRTGD